MSNQEHLSLEAMPVELAVIINSFNRLSLLSKALPSIIKALDQTSLKATVIVFDAGSNDGSREFIEKFSSTTQEPQIICLNPLDNNARSFSAGCNYAVQFAVQKFSQLKYCFFFETDNLISNQSALPLAIELLEREEKLAAVGFTVEKCDGRKAGFGVRFPTPLSFILGQQLSHLLGLERMQIRQWYPLLGARWGFSDIVFTSPLLIRYSAWQSTNGMDTASFPYSDCDGDWCWMAHKKSWCIAVLDVPGVIHDNQMQLSPWSGNRVINFHQARLRLLLKHRGRWIALLKPLLFVRHCLELLLLAVRNKNSSGTEKSLAYRLKLLANVFNNYELS